MSASRHLRIINGISTDPSVYELKFCVDQSLDPVSVSEFIKFPQRSSLHGPGASVLGELESMIEAVEGVTFVTMDRYTITVGIGIAFERHDIINQVTEIIKQLPGKDLPWLVVDDTLDEPFVKPPHLSAPALEPEPEPETVTAKDWYEEHIKQRLALAGMAAPKEFRPLIEGVLNLTDLLVGGLDEFEHIISKREQG
ncbi:MAG: hypothetical protein JWN38_6 [Candidatus Saccharibacteria bacterium]|nr:hypothetical protein [Candidatus Saccharibacteria bacterium]